MIEAPSPLTARCVNYSYIHITRWLTTFFASDCSARAIPENCLLQTKLKSPTYYYDP